VRETDSCSEEARVGGLHSAAPAQVQLSTGSCTPPSPDVQVLEVTEGCLRRVALEQM